MLHVIPHLEHGIGTFLPEGGMRTIPVHLERLARAVGTTILTRTPARKILHQHGQVQGVEDHSGTIHRADLVVSNADLHPTYRSLLPDIKAPESILGQERSTSGVVFYWGVREMTPGWGFTTSCSAMTTGRNLRLSPVKAHRVRTPQCTSTSPAKKFRRTHRRAMKIGS